MTEMTDLSQKQRFLLLSKMNHIDNNFDQSIIDSFPTYMRYKGEAQIAVDDVDAAKLCLASYIEFSDYLFSEVYPENFFISGLHTTLPLIKTGKLNIPHVNLFLQKLINDGVKLYNYDFDQNSCDECN
jgi:hypothetical protein